MAVCLWVFTLFLSVCMSMAKFPLLMRTIVTWDLGLHRWPHFNLVTSLIIPSPSQVWWHMPLVLAIWQVEAGELIEPGVQNWSGQHREILSLKKRNLPYLKIWLHSEILGVGTIAYEFGGDTTHPMTRWFLSVCCSQGVFRLFFLVHIEYILLWDFS
jgi:hypothetical protein